MKQNLYAAKILIVHFSFTYIKINLPFMAGFIQNYDVKHFTRGKRNTKTTVLNRPVNK